MSTSRFTFRVDGMHCASCALLVDDTLTDLPGVISSDTSRRAGRTVVELEPGPTTPDGIAAAITVLGYRAELTE